MKAFKAGDVLKIQICDGPDGCGRIFEDKYGVPQRCAWQQHIQQPKYSDPMKLDNAPTCRQVTVILVDPEDEEADMAHVMELAVAG